MKIGGDFLPTAVSWKDGVIIWTNLLYANFSAFGSFCIFRKHVKLAENPENNFPKKQQANTVKSKLVCPRTIPKCIFTEMFEILKFFSFL